MHTASGAPVFWEDYLYSLLASSGKGASDLGIWNPRLLDRENLAPVGKLLVQLKINHLLKGVLKPPVPLPDLKRCHHERCRLDWFDNVYVVADSTIRTAALSFRRRNVDGEKFTEFQIRVNPAALPPDRKYLNMVVAHEIAHLLFVQELPNGELTQYMNLTHNPGKAKAEWLIYELAREIVAPTRLLTQHLAPPSTLRPAVVEMVRVSQEFGIPERELAGTLLHSNAYLSWFRINPEVRTWLAQNPYVSHLLFEFMRKHAPSPLLSWAKSLVIILDFAKNGAVKLRKYIGKLWGQASNFSPDETYQIQKRVQAKIAINQIISQCTEWLDLAKSKQQYYTLNRLVHERIDKGQTLGRCPELGKLIRQWKYEHVLEVFTKKTHLGHRAYIIIRPYQPDREGLRLDR